MTRFVVWCLFLGVVALVAVRVAGTDVAAPFALVVVSAGGLLLKGTA